MIYIKIAVNIDDSLEHIKCLVYLTNQTNLKINMNNLLFYVNNIK